MDAADEIAYSMSDLEDGLEKSILSEEDLKKEFGNDSLPNGVIKPFVAFKTKTINLAAKEAANKFVSSLDEILSGEPVDLIGSNSEAGELLNKVGKIARERIYCHKAAEQVELAGRSVIKGLLNHFGELLELPEDDFLNIVNKDSKETRKKGLEFQARLYNRLPNSYCEKYQESTRESEPDRRAHLIVDFISGMTDDFALETYQILEGIRVK
ncbi:Deoxyguanosinetriphosphate triphosphohydrolase [compost metagenome]